MVLLWVQLSDTFTAKACRCAYRSKKVMWPTQQRICHKNLFSFAAYHQIYWEVWSNQGKGKVSGLQDKFDPVPLS